MRHHALFLSILLLAPAAVAAAESHRYVVALGVPVLNSFVHCGLAVRGSEASFNVPGAHVTVNGQPVGVEGRRVVLFEGGTIKPNHGGACVIPVTEGETITARLVDDLDPEAAFGFGVFFGNRTAEESSSALDCGPRLRGVQQLTFVVPDCNDLAVIPDMVSLSGTVYLTRD